MEIITDFSALEHLLLPDGCTFSNDARDVINCWESKEILACPGSGKTTVLIAKLKVIADNLPLESGRGVCVLSHTNVAVNELKAKLGLSADRLLSFPNFVGTIQTFVDHYITFPYLRQFTSSPIQVVSKDEYARHLYSEICKSDKKLKWFIEQRYKESEADRFASIQQYLANVYLDEQRNLRVANNRRALAGSDTNTAFSYRVAIHRLLRSEGIIEYSDTYRYTLDALSFYGEALRVLLSSRFQYIFIDEYQDCSELQRNVLDSLFSNTDTIFQKIGDSDQAIYNFMGEKTPIWQVAGEYLSITNSNRYSQDIADVLTLLRTGKEIIHSERGSQGIKPTLFIFDDSSRLKVLPAFATEIQFHGLVRPNGVYKAIGMYKNVNGLKIGDYLTEYQNIESQNTTCHSTYIQEIISGLHKGQLYIAEQWIRKLICKVLPYCEIRDDAGNTYGTKTVKKYISNNYFQEYANAIIHLANLQETSYSTVDEKIRELLNIVCGNDWDSKMPDAFTQPSVSTSSQTQSNNICYYDDIGISIMLDTVHGVKGETHDATLYLETEIHNGSDIKRIMPLLENKSIKKPTDLHEKSRRCVYVGFSRPKHLLCLAIKESTYINHESAFTAWNVVDLRDSSGVFL